uniref:Protein arginine N-methyltransferase n=1 Tax=Rhizophora mucronata TaxID=61149 RepID=A0A2P2MP20_RHIMU
MDFLALYRFLPVSLLLTIHSDYAFFYFSVVHLTTFRSINAFEVFIYNGQCDLFPFGFLSLLNVCVLHDSDESHLQAKLDAARQ